jgi:hypothetical protein
MSTKDITDLMVCAAVTAYKTHGLPFSDERLHLETGQPIKVCERAMERAYRRGLIEYGVSLRSGWLTEEGEALLGKPS